MTYRETAPRTSANLVDKIAVVLSKRQDRIDLAAGVFAELINGGANSATLWQRENRASTTFFVDQSSCRTEAGEALDASKLEQWKEWSENGSREPAMLDNADDVFGGSAMSKHSVIMPIHAQDGSVIALLSVNHGNEQRLQNHQLTPTVAQLLLNAIYTDKRSSQNSTLQLQNELWLEHNHRLIIQRIISRLDRDYVLQSAVDTLGNMLKVSSCLILNCDPSQKPRITHEYVDPELSPLGLGWSMAIPPVIAAQMCERTTVLEESGIRKHEQSQIIDGAESMYESSIRSLVGTPILSVGTSLGALVVQSDRERRWQREEIKLLEATAHAISIALRNADLYQEAKEQVFNLNLVSNLTRQLSTAVEQIYRAPQKSEPSLMMGEDEDGVLQAGKAPPLSARELEVLRLIASGLANREIAQRLFLTESTVELHASRIRKKLKLKSRTALVKYACDNHLV